MDDEVTEGDIQAAQAGDEVAFTRLYRATQPWLVKYAVVLAGADAEDVCSETWLHACRDLGSFRGDPDGFRAWIARIARNRAIDAGRRAQRRPMTLLPPEDMPVPASETSGEDAALTAMATTQALRRIAQLPREQAEAVLMRSVLGFDAKTAAAMLGRRPGAVRTAAYRGLRELARRLEEDETPAPTDPLPGHRPSRTRVEGTGIEPGAATP